MQAVHVLLMSRPENLPPPPHRQLQVSMDYDIDDDEDELFEDANDEVPVDNEEAEDDTMLDEGDVDGEEDAEDDDDNDNEENDDNEDDNEDDVEGEGDDVDENVVEETAGSNQGFEPRQPDQSGRKTPPPISPILEGSFKQRHPLKCDSKYINCRSYDIVPTIAIPHSCGIYSIATSWGLKWLFTGGQDGFIRKYNFAESVDGKTPLTVAQRHSFVDSVVNAGVLYSYWENEQPLPEKEARARAGSDGLYEPMISPVYSLEVQSEALWLLAGLEKGGITLQTVRHGEGQIHAYLDKHTSAVSVIKLDDTETRALSGSWDSTVVEWDLNVGKEANCYDNLSGQVSSLEWQPEGGNYVHQTLPPKNDSASQSANGKNSETNIKEDPDDDDDDDDKKSMESLFGDDDDDSGSSPKQTEPDQEPEPEPESTEVKPPVHSYSVFMTSTIDGTISIWDRRMKTRAASAAAVKNVTPPWCESACWSTDGNFIYAGRRNSTVDEYDIRKFGTPSRVLKFPSVSGAVSAVCALPTGNHVLCGSHDNVRLYDLRAKEGKTPFYIIPGHHGGVLSSIFVDPNCRYMITASGSRGWQGTSTDVTIIYEIEPL